MNDQNETKMQLMNELAELRQRIAELEAFGEKRKQAEEAFRESEERYRTAIEHSNDGVAIVHGSQHLFVNQKFAEMFGYDKPEEIVEKSLYMVVHPDDLKRVEELTLRRQSGKLVPSRYEYKGIRKDGKPIDIEISATKTIYRGQAVSLAYFRDITERKQAEEQYRTILRTTMDGFWITDIQGRYLDVNDAYCHLIGYSREELLTMRISDVEAVERPEETAQRIERIMETGGARFETRHRRKDGKIIDVEVSVNYMKVGNERLFVFLRDITERKRVEEERGKLIHELQEALASIKTLRGLLPICSYCKKIRDDKGYWNRIESYIEDHSGAEFTHGMCPECLKKFHPDLVD